MAAATVLRSQHFPVRRIYQAQIDFSTVASLLSDPFTLSAAPGNSATASSTFGATPSGVPVTSSIAVQLRFTLSPGDTASILSRFDVVPGGTIPEPGYADAGRIVLAFASGSRAAASASDLLHARDQPIDFLRRGVARTPGAN